MQDGGRQFHRKPALRKCTGKIGVRTMRGAIGVSPRGRPAPSTSRKVVNSSRAELDPGPAGAGGGRREERVFGERQAGQCLLNTQAAEKCDLLFRHHSGGSEGRRA